MTTEPTTERLRFTLPELAAMKPNGEKIVMVTAYDAPGARLADEVGIELILVGDSAAMVVLGHDSTVPATVDEMIVLTRAARRGADRALLVADMPFGSFQVSDDGGPDQRRPLHQGGRRRCGQARGRRRVAVAGAGHRRGRDPGHGPHRSHPQSATMLGGFKAQGRTAAKARALLADAQALQDAGCFAIVLEAVPGAGRHPDQPGACGSRPSASVPEPAATARCWCGMTCWA